MLELRSLSIRHTRFRAAVIAAGLFASICLSSGQMLAQAPQQTPVFSQLAPTPTVQPSTATAKTEAETESLVDALVRRPLAALLGTALALRPKRRGTPARTTAVVQTQIILAVVGAVIMLVVGASLARAFGIVGAANLIRYRSKIDDPKDAVVMLCSLAVGLASGVGLYRLALFSTGFLVASLWVIESFEPKPVKTFRLSVKKEDSSDELRGRLESVLKRYRLKWDLRILADEQVSYEVQVPVDMKTDMISQAIADLDPQKIAVEWDEKKQKSA